MHLTSLSALVTCLSPFHHVPYSLRRQGFLFSGSLWFFLFLYLAPLIWNFDLLFIKTLVRSLSCPWRPP